MSDAMSDFDPEDHQAPNAGHALKCAMHKFWVQADHMDRQGASYIPGRLKEAMHEAIEQVWGDWHASG